LQKVEVPFIAVRREIEVAGNASELFLFNRLFVLLHKGLIGSLGNPRSPDRVSFRPQRNLVGMEVVEAKLVEECLFDDLMREQERFDPDRLQQPATAEPTH